MQGHKKMYLPCNHSEDNTGGYAPVKWESKPSKSHIRNIRKRAPIQEMQKSKKKKKHTKN